MTKFFLFLFCSLCCRFAWAQALPTAAEIAAIPRDQATGAVHYSLVEAVEGATKEVLYARAKTWSINAYTSPRDVITTEDKEAGIIICKGFAEEVVKLLIGSSRERLYFTVKLSMKDGRYKYDLSDLYYQSFPTASNPIPEQTPLETYLNTAYSASGKPYKPALYFVQPFISRATMLDGSIKKAMKGGEDW